MAGVIASGNQHTSAAGFQALESGGTAVDAALAATFASFVCEPLLSSAGGGGLMLIKPPNEAPRFIDFFPFAPSLQNVAASTDRDFFAVDIDFGETVQRFHVGRAAAAMPFALASLIDVHRRWGTLPLREVLAPAIHAAREGVALGVSGAEVFRLLWPIVTQSDATRDVLTNGHPPAPDEPVRNPAFAQLLERIASRGETPPALDAAILDAFGTDKGGTLSRADLRASLPPIADALHMRRHGWQIWTAAKPGGRAVCDIVDRCPPCGGDEAAFALALARASALADPAASPDGNHPPTPGSTTHVSVIDRAGFAVSVTTSNGEGCGHLIPGFGVLMNNFLGESDLNPRGFFQHPAAAPLPTMMAPTIAQSPEGDVIVLGSGGANRIRSAVSGTLLRLIGGASLDDAVLAPRVHAEADQVWFEQSGWRAPREVEATLDDAFTARTAFARRAFFFGGVHGVSREANGTLRGCGDPRRAGARCGGDGASPAPTSGTASR